MRSDLPLLLQILRQERTLAELQDDDWDLLIRQAKRCKLVAKLYYLAEDEQLLKSLATPVLRHLESARVHADKQYRDFLWEAGKLESAFADSGQPLIFLKGAAYAFAQLKPYKGRLFSDIDLLVSFDALATIERRLMLYGWLLDKQEDYNQQYYRRWMHELPPLRHVKRGSVVDLHHNILPRTAKGCPNAKLLLDAAVGVVDEYPNIKVLSPLDRVIHSATHLFYEGELEHGLRDLLDLQGLIAELDADARLLLVERALQLGLQQPVYYALHYLQRILKTDGLNEALLKFKSMGYVPSYMGFMDVLFLKALMPDHVSFADRWTGLARWCLFVRSHWLKMPWYLLLPHLSRKAWMRLTGKEQH